MERNEAIAVNYPSSLSLSPPLSLPPLSLFPLSLFSPLSLSPLSLSSPPLSLLPPLSFSLSLYPSFSLLEYHIDGQFLTKVTPNFIGKNRKELLKNNLPSNYFLKMKSCTLLILLIVPFFFDPYPICDFINYQRRCHAYRLTNTTTQRY